MGGVGVQSSHQASNSQQQIPQFQKKYLADLYSRAQSEVGSQPQQYYPGQTVASQDPATLQANQLMLQRGAAGSPLVDAAQSQTQDVIQGRYLSPESNPYLRGTYDQAAQAVTDNYRNSVLPDVTSRFARAGQLDSAGYTGARNYSDLALSRSLGDLGNSIYGGAYNAERGRQDAASLAAPGLAETDYRDIGAIGAVGASREDQQQRLLDDLIARFDFKQNEPAQRLSRYASLLGNPITLDSSRSRASSGGFNLSVGGSLPGL